MSNEILYATSFRNEQTASGAPSRIIPISDGATVQNQSIDDLGYTFQLTLPTSDSTWSLDLPVEASARWVKRHLTLRINSGGAGTYIDALGLPIVGGRVYGTNLETGVLYRISTVYDTVEGVGSAYINGRYVGAASDSNHIIISNESNGSVSITLLITDILVCESADDGSPVKVDFIDQMLAEVYSDGWSYSGDTLIDSIDKVNVTDTEPNISTYRTGSSMFLMGDKPDLPQLIEAAGSLAADVDKYSLIIRSIDVPSRMLEPLDTNQQAFKGVLIGPGVINLVRTYRPLEIEIDTVKGQTLNVNLISSGESVQVDFGDGESVAVTGSYNDTHTYEASVKRTLRIFGKVSDLEVSGNAITRVLDWGNLDLGRVAFYTANEGSANLVEVPTNLPNTITSLANCFRDCTSFNQDVSVWDTHNVLVMDNMFNGASVFNHDLQYWCVENIPEEPAGFADGAVAWTENKPVWGTCIVTSIGTPGTRGFGVGICFEDSWLAELGLSPMEGTENASHDNYGNYQHENGGISVFIPKFYYRIGHPSSPRYAKYGVNAFDIAGTDVFSNTDDANAEGYALHRAFIDDGKEKPGFFYDKYLASKDGTTSCKSVRGGHPISLATNAGYEPSSSMVGCTGILADSVVLSRARGYGWNTVSLFMVDAIAKISMAHGQAATSADFCAWYDPTDTTNFPKGCNNNALGDFNDPTVTFQMAISTKPLTGSASDLAKTTHNGQACGITDVNGAMYQATIGVTQAGTSATANSRVTTGHAYVLKRTSRHADLTGGWNGANDAWGNDAALASRFDLISGFLPWGSTTGWVNFGNGNNQVFSGASTGTDYLRSCAGIQMGTSSMSAAGTPLFGNDGCYQYTTTNLVPVVAGTWNVFGRAGVFFRYWGFHRTLANSTNGFRAAAYGS